MKFLVTGANGHVGLALCELLLQRGHDVRGSMRGAADAEKSDPLRKLGVEPVEADVLDGPALEKAATGMDGMFHVAAVYKLVAKDPEREILAPAIQGAENALRAAKKAGMKRVVLTSSTVVVGTRRTSPERPLDERDWNDHAVGPYPRAKTRAERRAVELAQELGLELVAVNPSGVLGPGFHRHTPSTSPVRACLLGELPFAPPFRGGYVDVRDVAMGHALAMANPSATGRYVLNTRCLDIIELCRLVKEQDAKARVPMGVLPKWMLPMARGFDALMASTKGAPRQLSAEMTEEFSDRTVEFSANRAQSELGWKPRPIEETLGDTIRWIHQRRPPLWSAGA
jgi:dihydroflavonol-4-reductase